MSNDRFWKLQQIQRLLDNANKRAEDTVEQMVDEIKRPLSYQHFNSECQEIYDEYTVEMNAMDAEYQSLIEEIGTLKSQVDSARTKWQTDWSDDSKTAYYSLCDQLVPLEKQMAIYSRKQKELKDNAETSMHAIADKHEIKRWIILKWFVD
jgi:uncharacterized protein YukE